MPVIATVRDDIKALRGLHLYHFATSNCSQRVRLVLQEKGLEWTSHHINLAKAENATPEFSEINPKSVVPVLIDDGVTITESNDIIQYLDERFEGPTLTPIDPGDVEFMRRQLELSSQFQSALKLITHEFLFKPIRRMDEKQLTEYAKGCNNPELRDFMREFSKGFSRERISSALKESEIVVTGLESRLEDSEWLTGSEFGLTDIAWIVNLHRFDLMGFPLTQYPRTQQWLLRVRQRPAFHAAVKDYESRGISLIFSCYTLLRRLKGTSIATYLEGV